MPRIALIAALLAALVCTATARAGGGFGYPSSIEAEAGDPFDRALHGNCYWPSFYESPLATTYFTADLVGFRRDWDALQTFATLDTPTNPVLQTHNLVFTFQPGLRVVAGRWLNDRTAIEGTYLGLLQWDEARAVRNSTVNALGTAGNLFSPFSNFGDPALVGFDYNNFASIRVVSEFNNAELNLRQRLDTPPSCIQASALFGLRYINVRDRFVYRTESLEPVAPGTDTLVDITARNSLIGMQVGGTVEIQFERRAWLNFEVKGMLLRNGTSQQTSYTTGPLAGGGATVTGQRRQQRATLGADLAATFIWQLSPSLVARFGYQGIFIDGLALGSDNFLRNVPDMTTDPSALAKDGRLAYHGPFAGATLTW